MKELFDVYTIDRQKTGVKKQRGEELLPNEFRLVVHVCIFNERNQMLIQQKADEKNMNNIWDISAGGSAVAGETSRMAIGRELKEELGYDYNFTSKKPQLTIYFKEYINDIYIIRNSQVDIDNLVLQSEEVKDVKWATRDEICDLIAEKKFINFDSSYINLLFFMNSNGEGCVIDE